MAAASILKYGSGWVEFGSAAIGNWLNYLTNMSYELKEDDAAEPMEDVELPVTDRVLEWAAAISEHPNTFIAFPKQHLNLKSSYEMSGYQVSHASKVLALVPALAHLRHRLCPKQLTEKCFWRVYFLLLRNIQRKHAAATAEAAAGTATATTATATATAAAPATASATDNTAATVSAAPQSQAPPAAAVAADAPTATPPPADAGVSTTNSAAATAAATANASAPAAETVATTESGTSADSHNHTHAHSGHDRSVSVEFDFSEIDGVSGASNPLRREPPPPAAHEHHSTTTATSDVL